ncbi:NUMOD4 motif-containing HNH endonuclease [Aerococcaceae bacterium NML160702]|nr:NUMOD4 motif-containing HNH endonuclease [Aerococcaceae bacterium NML160702]
MTEWKYIEGYNERYKIYDDGRVEQLSGGEYKPKAQYDKGDGYMTVNLYKAGERHKAHTVHRLVAMHFMPTENTGLVVNHKDGDKKNNNVSNLEWVTRKENSAHAVKHGLHNSSALFTDKQVIEMRYAFDNGYRNIGQLAEDYGASRNVIKGIVERKTYKERENMSFYQVTYYVKQKLLNTTVLAKTVKDAREMIKQMTPLAKIKGVEKKGELKYV